jgi:hypothetical protein
MPAIHDPRDEQNELADRFDPDDPDDPIDADDRDDDDEFEPAERTQRVVRRPNPLPSREEDEEELAEADILEELDLEDYDRRGGFSR